MTADRARLASCIAVAYIAVVLGGIFLHYALTREAYTLRFSLALPSTWLATAVSAAVAWGLWNRWRWAWWLGLTAVIFQLARMSWWMVEHCTLTNLPGPGVFVVLSFLLAFLSVLLLPSTRATCCH
jgi:hypothetical protein